MKLLRAEEVGRMLSLHKNTVFLKAREEADFPKPIKFSARCTRWRLEDIENWVAAKQGCAA